MGDLVESLLLALSLPFSSVLTSVVSYSLALPLSAANPNTLEMLT
jgi:hypothetical protein